MASVRVKGKKLSFETDKHLFHHTKNNRNEHLIRPLIGYLTDLRYVSNLPIFRYRSLDLDTITERYNFDRTITYSE